MQVDIKTAVLHEMRNIKEKKWPKPEYFNQNQYLEYEIYNILV